MKRSRFSEEWTIGILHEQEAGMATAGYSFHKTLLRPSPLYPLKFHIGGQIIIGAVEAELIGVAGVGGLAV